MPMRRTLKNVVYNFSDAEIKVREATSNDPWGPSSTLMSEIADLTYNVVAFTEIMQMIWKRLNDHGKHWRHVYKALVLLDYIIKTGSEKVAQQCKENIFAIQTLRDFQYVEDSKDQGMNVREKAKQLAGLLKDDERLKNERAKALKAKERFAQNSMGISSTGQRVRGPGSTPTSPTGYRDITSSTSAELSSPTQDLDSELEAARPATVGEEELQLQLALAMSKEEHDEDSRRMRADDVRLQMALEESQGPNDEVSPDSKQSSDGTLLDLMGGHQAMGAPIGAAKNDPWGAEATIAPPIPAPARHPQSIPAASDPWAPTPPSSSLAQPAPSSLPHPAAAVVNDAWTPQASGPPAQNSDPWSSPSPAAQPVMPMDPWGAPVSSNGMGATTNGTNVDDAFDLLSNRSASTGPEQTHMGPSNPWDMSGLGANMPVDTLIEGPRSKSATDFLGDHKALVNLENLISKPAPAAPVNPFGAPQPVHNPFGPQQQAARVPMNQMQTATAGFAPDGSGGNSLPAPLLPVGQASANNPFL